MGEKKLNKSKLKTEEKFTVKLELGGVMTVGGL